MRYWEGQIFVSRFPNTQHKRVAANTWGKSAEMSLRVSKYLDYTLYLAIMGIMKSRDWM